MRCFQHLLVVLIVLGTAPIGVAADARSLFDKRIVPILKSPKPSSCAECHLSGVDLKDYIRETQAETFGALVKGGLIDVKQPDASKLLEFIRRAPQRATPVSAQVRT